MNRCARHCLTCLILLTTLIPVRAETNSFYVNNRLPLAPARFIALPVGAVQPRGWLREMLLRQRDGLSGHLGEISVWLQKDDNAWLSKDGQGKYGWEELPYWLRGYLELAYILNDPKMIAEGETWIHGALQSQRAGRRFRPRSAIQRGRLARFLGEHADDVLPRNLLRTFARQPGARFDDEVFPLSTFPPGQSIPHPLLAEDARRRQSL